MRTIAEVVEDIKSILNNIERTEECYGETLVDINELADEILTINSVADESVKVDLISRSAFAKSIECMAQNGWDVSIGKYIWDNINDFIDSLYELLQDEPTAYNDGWIPVDKGLPKPMETVLVTTKHGTIYTAFQNEHGEWEEDMNCFVIDVIAWQPLPALYQPKGE